MVVDMRTLLEQERKRRLQPTTAAPRLDKDVPLLQMAALEQAQCDLGAASVGAGVVQDLPPFIRALIDKMVAAGVYAPEESPNHCLVNDYQPGGGIQAHRDGLLYAPRVATLTLGGPALMAFHRALPDGSPGHSIAEVLLTEGCLFLTTGEAYSSCLHSIASRQLDIVTQNCCNARAAGAAIGDEIPRPVRRVSLVFVHKLAQHRMQ